MIAIHSRKLTRRGDDEMKPNKLIQDCEKPTYYRKLGYQAVKQGELIQDTVAKRRAKALAQLQASQPKLF